MSAQLFYDVTPEPLLEVLLEAAISASLPEDRVIAARVNHPNGECALGLVHDDGHFTGWALGQDFVERQDPETLAKIAGDLLPRFEKYEEGDG